MGTYFYIFLRIPTIFDINKRDGCKERFRLQCDKTQGMKEKKKKKGQLLATNKTKTY